MARLAIFTERYTIRRAVELTALTNFRIAAAKLGHDCDFLFRSEIMNIPRYDGLLIRALTDPLNTSYVAARLAEVHGLRVIDEPDSIMVCCDKVNMYQHLMRADVPIPDTCFLTDDEVTVEQARELFEIYGRPLVLKAPNSSFSAYVEKVHDEANFVKVGKRFLRPVAAVALQSCLDLLNRLEAKARRQSWLQGPRQFRRSGALGHRRQHGCGQCPLLAEACDQLRYFGTR